MTPLRLIATLTALLVSSPAVSEAGPSLPRIQHIDSGTGLTVELSVGGRQCTDAEGGVVELDARLRTTGSVDSVDVLMRVADGEPAQVGTIEPGDFSRIGRIKYAGFETELGLENGKHDVMLCFVQSGAKGRPAKQVCASIRIAIGCAPPPGCFDDVMFFGDVARNPELCGGNGPPHVPIHFRGSLYDAVTVAIEGPGGFGLSLPLRKSGDSCNHHGLWDTRDGHGGPGLYTFTAATEDAVLATVDRELSCGR